MLVPSEIYFFSFQIYFVTYYDSIIVITLELSQMCLHSRLSFFPFHLCFPCTVKLKTLICCCLLHIIPKPINLATLNVATHFSPCIMVLLSSASLSNMSQICIWKAGLSYRSFCVRHRPLHLEEQFEDDTQGYYIYSWHSCVFASCVIACTQLEVVHQSMDLTSPISLCLMAPINRSHNINLFLFDTLFHK